MYLIVKSLHIIFIVTWFAGLFYIVRLFIYHTEALNKNEPDRSILHQQLAKMSRLLWYVITWPSAILTLILAITLLSLQPSWLEMSFMHIKLGFVFLLYLYHFSCQYIFNLLQKKVVRYSSTQLRIWNEVATLLLVIIVFLIILKNSISWIWATVGFILFGIILMLAIKIYKKVRGA